MRRTILTLAGGLAAVLIAATPAAAHVTVNPKQAAVGQTVTLTFRVPNERAPAATTSIEVALPDDVVMATVTPAAKGAWAPTTTRDGDRVRSFGWSGGRIGGEEVEAFDVALGPLPNAPTLVFKALQTYSDGEVVRWLDSPAPGDAHAGHPAPVLMLAGATPNTQAAATTAGPPTTIRIDYDPFAGLPGGSTGLAAGAAVLLVVGAAGVALLLVWSRRAR